ncbi:MAG: nucleotidyltransferase [Chitinophagaceae bacterium]|nr:nucleotidyltransferase [Chitinophagaceae bacterium]
MSKPTLVILAAGMASRYGSMKQVAGFGPSGETIMDYSIYDAVRAGFGKIVFIIREQFEENFRSIFEPKLKGKVETAYVFQELDKFTGDFNLPEGRTKPWGTAHAVLCARDVVKEPFAVINADDFYGRDSFEKAAAFLHKDCSADHYAIVAYDLTSTLSDHGTVNRGVCILDEKGHLAGIVERINIGREEGKIVVGDGLEPKELSIDTRVSMNFWCFDISFFDYTQQLFHSFLQAHGEEPKSEFFIPIVADQFIREGHSIELLKTIGNWFGVTYKEDAPFVQKSIDSLISSGEYPASLWK